jgi:hypothetical protein
VQGVSSMVTGRAISGMISTFVCKSVCVCGVGDRRELSMGRAALTVTGIGDSGTTHSNQHAARLLSARRRGQ